MPTRLLAVALLASGLTACRNSCQRLCAEMRDYAADECGLEWDRAALRECIREHDIRDTTFTERRTCSDDLRTLRDEWTCDDLALYFDTPTTDDTGE